MNFTLLDDSDVSQAYAAYLRELRQQAKLSRAALAERSCVPAATISEGSVKQQCLRLLRHWSCANRKMQRFFNEVSK